MDDDDDDDGEAVSSGRADNLSSGPPKKPNMANQGVLLLKPIDQKNTMMLPPLLPGKETKK